MAQIKDTTELYNFLIDLDPTFGDDKTFEQFEVDMEDQQYQQQISNVTGGEWTPPTKENHLFGVDEVLAEIPIPPIPYSPPVPQDAFIKKPVIIGENIINTSSIKTPLGLDEVEIETKKVEEDPITFSHLWLTMDDKQRKSFLTSSSKSLNIVTDIDSQTITDLGELNNLQDIDTKVEELFKVPLNGVNKMFEDWGKKLDTNREKVQNSKDQLEIDEFNADLKKYKKEIKLWDYLANKYNELINEENQRKKTRRESRKTKKFKGLEDGDKQVQLIYRDKDGEEKLVEILSYNDIYEKHIRYSGAYKTVEEYLVKSNARAGLYTKRKVEVGGEWVTAGGVRRPMYIYRTAGMIEPTYKYKEDDYLKIDPIESKNLEVGILPELEIKAYKPGDPGYEESQEKLKQLEIKKEEEEKLRESNKDLVKLYEGAWDLWFDAAQRGKTRPHTEAEYFVAYTKNLLPPGFSIKKIGDEKAKITYTPKGWHLFSGEERPSIEIETDWGDIGDMFYTAGGYDSAAKQERRLVNFILENARPDAYNRVLEKVDRQLIEYNKLLNTQFDSSNPGNGGFALNASQDIAVNEDVNRIAFTWSLMKESGNPEDILREKQEALSRSGELKTESRYEYYYNNYKEDAQQFYEFFNYFISETKKFNKANGIEIGDSAYLSLHEGGDIYDKEGKIVEEGRVDHEIGRGGSVYENAYRFAWNKMKEKYTAKREEINFEQYIENAGKGSTQAQKVGEALFGDIQSKKIINLEIEKQLLDFKNWEKKSENLPTTNLEKFQGLINNEYGGQTVSGSNSTFFYNTQVVPIEEGERYFELDNGLKMPESLYWAAMKEIGDINSAKEHAASHYKKYLDKVGELDDFDERWKMYSKNFNDFEAFWWKAGLSLHSTITNIGYAAWDLTKYLNPVWVTTQAMGGEDIATDVMLELKEGREQIFEELGSVDFKDKDLSFGHAFSWYFNELFATNLGPLALAITLPGYGAMAGTFSDSYGREKLSMIDLTRKGMAEYSEAEWWLRPTGFGLAEAVPAYFGTIANINRVKNAVKASKEAMGELYDNVGMHIANNVFGKKGILVSGYTEGMEEYVTNGLQNWMNGDFWSLNAKESVVSGVFMGWGHSTPLLVTPLTKNYTNQKEIKDINERNLAANKAKATILKLEKTKSQFNNKYDMRFKTNKEGVKKIDQQIKAQQEIIETKKAEIETILEGIDQRLTKEGISEAAIGLHNENVRRQAEIRTEVNETLLDKNIPDQQKQKQIDELRKEYAENERNINMFTDKNTFGQAWYALKSPWNLLDRGRREVYNTIRNQAIANIKKRRGQEQFFTEITEEQIDKEAINIYNNMEFDKSAERALKFAKKIGADLIIAEDNVEGTEIVTDLYDQLIEGETNETTIKELEAEKQRFINAVKSGKVNGWSSTFFNQEIVLKENAVKNRMVHTWAHELMHNISRKLLATDEKAFMDFGKQVENYLRIYQPSVWKKIYLQNTNLVDKSSLTFIKPDGSKETIILEENAKGEKVIPEKYSQTLKDLPEGTVQQYQEIDYEELISSFFENVAEGRVDLNKLPGIKGVLGKLFQGAVDKASNGEVNIDFKGTLEVDSFFEALGVKEKKGIFKRFRKPKVVETKTEGKGTTVAPETKKSKIRTRADETETLLEAINNLLPKDIDTKAKYDEFIRDERKAKVIRDSLTKPGGAINNYIRSKQISKEEGDQMIENTLFRLFNFNPEETRADGSVVGPEGFGERIFADTRFASMDARKELAKEAEKKKRTASIDTEQARQIATPTETTKQEKPVRKGIVVADRLEGKAKVAVEKIQSKITTQALTGAKELGPITKEEQIEYLEKQTYKSLKDLVSEETQKMFGIKPKPGNLTKQDVKNAQMFIAKNPDLFYALLPEQHTTKTVNVGTKANPKYVVRPDKATGVQNVLLEAFYNKGTRKDNLTPWTKKPASDVKTSEFLDLFGITEKGDPNLYKKSTNISARIKALVEQTGRLITNQTVRQAVPEAMKVGEGRSKVMFSETMQDDLVKIASLRDIAKAAKEMDIDKISVDEYNFKEIQKQILEAIETFGFDVNIFEAGALAFGGAVRGKVGDTRNKDDKALNKWLKDNNKKAKKGDYYYKLAGGKGWIIGKKGKNGFSVPLDSEGNYRDDLVPQKGRVYYGKKDPAYQKALAAAKKNVAILPKTQRLSPPVKGINKAWIIKNEDQASINMESLEDVTLELAQAVHEGVEIKDKNGKIKKVKMPLNLAALIITQGYQATTGLIKIAAPFEGVSSDFDFAVGKGKNSKRSAKDKPYIEEHTIPASVLGASLIYAIKNNKVKEIFPYVKKNYIQIQLSKADNELLDMSGVDATLPPDMSILNSPLVRLAYAGINLNTIKNPLTGKLLIEEAGLGVPVEYQNIPEVYYMQNQLFLATQDFFNPNAPTIKQAKADLDAYLPIGKSENAAAKVNRKNIDGSGVVNLSQTLPNSEILREASIMDKALNIARDPNAPVKKIRVFDFDDTLARTKSNVLYTMPDGKTGKLTAEEFAKDGTQMLEQGAEFDFSEFNKVMEGKKGPLFEVAKTIQNVRGTQDVFVLTARAMEAAPAIKEFLDSIGLDIPLENITGLGDSSPLAKSGWIVDKAADGYNDFYFADDHMANVNAVKKVLDVIDVKSKVQQAKVKFSKNVDEDFNKIIEQKTGVEWYKEYSAARAQTEGAGKGRFRFLIPPSAEDFTGLLYRFLGRGKVGDAQMAWFKEHLLNPYARGMNDLSTDRVTMMNDFNALKKELIKSKSIPKNLKKKAVGNFTYEDVARVMAWDQQGIEVADLSKRDMEKFRKFIKDNPGLQIFVDQLIAINKGDGYAYPGKNWLAGSITTDLIEGLNTNKRDKYLQQWRENVDLIFSEKNLNKIEALFGSRYREALEDSLRRMKSGKNRTSTGSRLENRVLDYINNSIGTVMFLNMRSGVLQTISAINFLNWKDNNPLKAGMAFANQKQYWSDFMMLMNSDFLVDRRKGLKINVSESEIADAARNEKNKARAVINYLLKKGFTVTQIMDSFAIASGGATFYRNRVKSLMKGGMNRADAEAQAFQDFRETAEESQQSSRPDKISQQQASGLGRVILAFANTPLQYNRIIKKATLDLLNGRGDYKTNLSKIVYYGMIQNLIFTALQQAVFAMGFGDDEEEEVKKEKFYKVGNSMLDNLLRGIGIGGQAVLTVKNIGMDVYERYQKSIDPDASFFDKQPDYAQSAWHLLDFSPPISIKARKLRQAADNWKYNKWRHDKNPWSLDDPAWASGAYVISALTNIPLDRLVKKMDNVRGAMESDQEWWKRVAMLSGWAEWELESTADRTKRKEKESIERRHLRAEGNLGIYNKAEQEDILKQYGLREEDLKKLKNEDQRVEKIKELQKKTKKTYLPNKALAPKKKSTTTATSYKPSTKVSKIKTTSTVKKDETKTVKQKEDKLVEKKEDKSEEVKPIKVRKKILIGDRTDRQARLYNLSKQNQLDTLESLGVTPDVIKTLKYEEDRVRKIEELYDENK